MPKGKHNNHAKESDHPRWNEGKIKSSNGYARIRVGKTHPLADPNGYAYEHHIIWASSGNKPLKEGEILHHINDDKSDNRLKNLQVLTRAEHNRLHNLEKERNKKSQFTVNKRSGRLLDGREWNETP